LNQHKPVQWSGILYNS